MKNFNSLSEISDALNNDLLQINELPEIINSSGLREGDRDMSLAIDDQAGSILLYDEEKDLFVVESYEPIEPKVELLTRQIDKIDDIIKELSGDCFLDGAVRFLSMAKENLAGYRDIL